MPSTRSTPFELREVWRRFALRLVACALPYVILAWIAARFGDTQLLTSMWLYWCVIIIPTLGSPPTLVD
jgi:dipeptide/tripeptide permease